MKSSTPAKRRRLDKKVSSNLLDSTEIRKRYLEEHMLKKKTWHLSGFSKKIEHFGNWFQNGSLPSFL